MITASTELAANPLETLSELELRIARRADQLAATHVGRSSLNLVCWLEAEQEILGPILKTLGGQTTQLGRSAN